MGANYPAEYGRSLGSVLNVVYKSGSNELPRQRLRVLPRFGLRPEQLLRQEARRHAARRLPAQPVRRRRRRSDPPRPHLLHDLVRRAARGSRLGNDDHRADEAQRNGDFSQTFAQNGQLIRVFDPFTTRPNPSGSGFIRDQFPGNVIPANRMDPVARQVLNYFPLPNQPGNADHRRTELLRDRHRAAERRQHRRARRSQPVGQGARRSSATRTARRSARRRRSSPRTSPSPKGRVNEQNLAHNAVIDYSRTISNTTLMSARFGFARTLFLFDNQGLGFRPSSLGLPTSIDSARRSRDVPALRRQRHGHARRQRPSLQRVHELHRAPPT